MSAALDHTLTPDEALERRIEAVRMHMEGEYFAGNLEAARVHARELSYLIALRSPEQVGRMERARCLRR